MILAFGRSQRHELAVLVDRGIGSCPFERIMRGKNVPTAQSETVRVFVKEIDRLGSAVIYGK